MREKFSKFSKVLALVLMVTLLACSHGQGGNASEWPTAGLNESVSETDHIDLGLRVLALELSRESEEETSYFMQFFPARGKIEVSCQFAALDLKKEDEKKSQVDGQVRLVAAGVAELFSGLTLGQGFDPQRHLFIRFSTKAPVASEFAIYEGGEVRWLAPPAAAR